jgi:hypothetical protein
LRQEGSICTVEPHGRGSRFSPKYWYARTRTRSSLTLKSRSKSSHVSVTATLNNTLILSTEFL